MESTLRRKKPAECGRKSRTTGLETLNKTKKKLTKFHLFVLFYRVFPTLSFLILMESN
jgi:hypothetical protein